MRTTSGAVRFGATIPNPPITYPFGERQYTAVDLVGHRWGFTQTVADVDPAECATVPSDFTRSVRSSPTGVAGESATTADGGGAQ